MRADVKLGVVISLAVVLVAGAYYLYRDNDMAPIPVADGSQPQSPTSGAATVDRSVKPTGKTAANQSAARPAKDKPHGLIPPSARTAQAKTGKKRPQDTQQTLRPSGSNARAKTHGRRRVSPPSPRRDRDGKAPAVARTDREPPTEKHNAAAKPGARLSGKGTEKAVTARDEGKARGGATERTKWQRTRKVPLRPPAHTSPRVAQKRPADRADSSTPSPGPSVARGGVAKASPSRGHESIPLASSRSGPRVRDRGKPEGLAADDLHRVQSGDTFSSLAQMYYGDAKYAQVLIDRNSDVASPDRLSIGMVIRIPPLPAQPAATRAGAQVVKAADRSASAGHRRTYAVKSGDTFYGIARDVLGKASRWREIYQLNKKAVGNDPSRLKVGLVLTLPE